MRLLVANLRKLVRRPGELRDARPVAALLVLVYATLIITARVSTDPSRGTRGPVLLITFPDAWVTVLDLILGVASFLALAFAGGGRGIGVVVGNAQGGRRARREPRRLPGLDAGRGRRARSSSGCSSCTSSASSSRSWARSCSASRWTPSATRTGTGRCRWRSLAPASPSRCMPRSATRWRPSRAARSRASRSAIGVYFVEGIGRFFASEILQWSPFGAAEARDVRRRARSSIGTGPGAVTLHQLGDPLAADRHGDLDRRRHRGDDRVHAARGDRRLEPGASRRRGRVTRSAGARALSAARRSVPSHAHASSATRSAGASSISSPRRPAETWIVGQPVADESSAVGQGPPRPQRRDPAQDVARRALRLRRLRRSPPSGRRARPPQP